MAFHSFPLCAKSQLLLVRSNKIHRSCFRQLRSQTRQDAEMVSRIPKPSLNNTQRTRVLDLQGWTSGKQSKGASCAVHEGSGLLLNRGYFSRKAHPIDAGEKLQNLLKLLQHLIRRNHVPTPRFRIAPICTSTASLGNCLPLGVPRPHSYHSERSRSLGRAEPGSQIRGYHST